MRIILPSLVLLSIALLVSGCATEVVELTHDGKSVRQIEPEEAKDCKFLKQVQAYTGTDSEDNLIATLRNKVGGLGGNAYVQLSTSESDSELGVKAEVYECPPKSDAK